MYTLTDAPAKTRAPSTARMPSILVIRDPHILYRHPRAGILEDGLDLGKLRRTLDWCGGNARTFALDTNIDTHARLQTERLAHGGGKHDLSFG